MSKNNKHEKKRTGYWAAFIAGCVTIGYAVRRWIAGMNRMN